MTPPKPRDYQVAAIDAGLKFFGSKKMENGIIVCPTGSGKSVIIANIAKDLPGDTMVFQPSKEILAQNFQKIMSYGYRASIYSASAGMKHVDKLTFAMIGSVRKKPALFAKVQNVIVDECHLVNPVEGMYKSFFQALGNVKVLGLTATPYRLASTMEGSELRFLTRQSPRVFNRLLYFIQNDILFERGYLAPLKYYTRKMIDRSRLQLKKNGSDFTEESLRDAYEAVNAIQKIAELAIRILAKRPNLLVFVATVKDCYRVAKLVPGSAVVHGETDAETRDRILKDFKAGRIRCVINVGVLDTGFDYPELCAVLDAISTASMAKYYQRVGRIMRPHTYPDGTVKEGWYVDMAGNFETFGKIETMKLEYDPKGLPYISNEIDGYRRQLTNVTFTKV